MSININNKRFSICNIIKKSEAIELLKNNLTAEELRALIQPNYNQLVKMLKLYSKKDIQYLLYNTHKIGMDKISNIIRKNAVMGGGDSEDEEIKDNILKKDMTNNLIDMEDDEEEEEMNSVENIEVKKLPAENNTQIIPYEINSVENIEVKKLPAENNTQKLLNENNAEINLTKKMTIEELNRELNEVKQVNINMENIQTSEEISLINNPYQNEVIEIDTLVNEDIDLMKKKINMEKLDKCYNMKKVREVLRKINLTEEQIIDYLKSNAKKIVEKMGNHKEYGKHFIYKTEKQYKDIYELMNILI